MPNNCEGIYRFTVPPRLTSHVRVRSLPSAACTVRREGADVSSPSLLVYSDPEGFLDLYVRPTNEHDESGRLTIDAEADGDSAQHVLELRAGRQPTAEMPSPPLLSAWRGESAQVRPALGFDEVLRITNEELLERGFPLRPDVDEAPQEFDGWLRVVTSHAVRVEPHDVARPDISYVGCLTPSAQPVQSYNWCGFVLEGASGTYDWVSAIWRVPGVSGENLTTTYSGIWIGLDGYDTTDLVQDGTGQDNVTFHVGPWNLDVSTYYAWTEFLPQQPTAHQITNFAVRPGDHIFSQLWIANLGMMPALSGNLGVVFIQNLTTGEFAWIYTPVGSTQVLGRSAEWIMERPTVNDQPSDLAKYGRASMLYALARRVGGSYVNYDDATSTQLKMINGDYTMPDVLSTVMPVDYATMRFYWNAFH
jgi:Peptidase A4 family